MIECKKIVHLSYYFVNCSNLNEFIYKINLCVYGENTLVYSKSTHTGVSNKFNIKYYQFPSTSKDIYSYHHILI